MELIEQIKGLLTPRQLSVEELVNQDFFDFRFFGNMQEEMEGFLYRYHHSLENPGRYINNLLITSDDAEKTDHFLDCLRNAMGELAGDPEVVLDTTEDALLDGDEVPAHASAPHRVVIVRGCKVENLTQWIRTMPFLEGTADCVKIVSVSTEGARRLHEDDHLFFRIFPKHFYLAPMDWQDVLYVVLQHLRRQGLQITEEFEAGITDYVHTVYPKADLRKFEFVEDLKKRINFLSFSAAVPARVLTEKHVPFYKPAAKLALEMEHESSSIAAAKPEPADAPTENPAVQLPSVPDELRAHNLAETILPLQETELHSVLDPSEQISVLICGLSTFRIDRNTGEYWLGASDFAYMKDDGSKGTVSGDYQLDPVPNMLQQEGINLDCAIMLATKETISAKDIARVRDGAKGHLSELEYFELVSLDGEMKHKCSDHSQFCVIPTAQNDPRQAISMAVRFLRELSDKAQGKKIRLILDTHGGFRDIELALQSIIYLLDPQKIETQVFSVQEPSVTEPGRVKKDTTMEMFSFVSGINEFINYGRMDSLDRARNENQWAGAETLKTAVHKIATAIQWCDVNGFEVGLKELNTYFTAAEKAADPGDTYLPLFTGRIREDYGKLLSDNIDFLEAIRWCLRKGFFQQAITILESKTHKILEDKGILVFPEEFKNVTKLTAYDVFSTGTYSVFPKGYSRVGTSKKKNIRCIFNHIFDTEEEKNPLEYANELLSAFQLCRAKCKTPCTQTQQGTTACKKTVISKVEEFSDNARFDDGNPKSSSGKSKLDEYDDLKNKGIGKAFELRTDNARELTALLLLFRIMKDVRNSCNHASEAFEYQSAAIEHAAWCYVGLMETLQPTPAKSVKIAEDPKPAPEKALEDAIAKLVAKTKASVV